MPLIETDRFVTMKQLPEYTGFSRRWMLDRIAESTFPQPIRVNSRKNLWRLSAVMQWMNEFEAAHTGVQKPNDICKTA